MKNLIAILVLLVSSSVFAQGSYKGLDEANRPCSITIDDYVDLNTPVKASVKVSFDGEEESEDVFYSVWYLSETQAIGIEDYGDGEAIVSHELVFDSPTKTFTFLKRRIEGDSDEFKYVACYLE